MGPQNISQNEMLKCSENEQAEKALPLPLAWHLTIQGHEKYAELGTVFTSE